MARLQEILGGTKAKKAMLVLILMMLTTTTAILNVNPRQNMWITWANYSEITDFCLSLQSATNPFRTCLIGIPLSDFDEFKRWVNDTGLKFGVNITNKQACKRGYPRALFCNQLRGEHVGLGQRMLTVANSLNRTATVPQELDLLGSIRSNYCVSFQHEPYQSNKGVLWSEPRNNSAILYPSYYKNIKSITEVCQEEVSRQAKVTSYPRQLPPGIFLICGDRAWPSVPANAFGGPCYFGKLSLFTPRVRNLIKSVKLRRRRSIKQFDKSCKDEVKLPNLGSVISLSLFLPGGMAATNARNLAALACWGQKQFNLSSEMIDELTTDVDSVRHATLQNRAAIDFLLLAQGHGCEEFEGMCCFNLSDHSSSVHQKLREMQENMKKITIGRGLLDEWFQSWGITGWVRDLLKMFGIILLILLTLLVMIPCVINMLQ